MASEHATDAAGDRHRFSETWMIPRVSGPPPCVTTPRRPLEFALDRVPLNKEGRRVFVAPRVLDDDLDAIRQGVMNTLGSDPKPHLETFLLEQQVRERHAPKRHPKSQLLQARSSANATVGIGTRNS